MVLIPLYLVSHRSCPVMSSCCCYCESLYMVSCHVMSFLLVSSLLISVIPVHTPSLVNAILSHRIFLSLLFAMLLLYTVCGCTCLHKRVASSCYQPCMVLLCQSGTTYCKQMISNQGNAVAHCKETPLWSSSKSATSQRSTYSNCSNLPQAHG